MKDVAKTSKNPTCSANSCFLSRKGGDGERPGLSWGCWSAGLGDRTGWDGGPSCESWGGLASLASHGSPLPIPPSPHSPWSSSSPLRHFCFIYENVAGIQMSYLFCGRLTFPQRASACLTQGPAETAWEEKESAKECFSALFIPSSPPSLFYFVCVRVCRAHSSLAVPPLLPSSLLSSPWPCFSPLYVTR